MTNMIRQPYETKRLDEERALDKDRLIKIRMRKDELLALEEAARVIGQEKLSTTIKQLCVIGANVAHGREKAEFAKVVLNNARRNMRLGIVEANPRFWHL